MRISRALSHRLLTSSSESGLHDSDRSCSMKRSRSPLVRALVGVAAAAGAAGGTGATAGAAVVAGGGGAGSSVADMLERETKGKRCG